ncbi:MAG TPA: 6-pyruvoyl tetrahydropterin synthase, partial [Candidatus Nitrosotalea sp.]|nr:6-pyruvoyl tetrahydropterin synthase [Candidatus Nitrosotalea sp.]
MSTGSTILDSDFKYIDSKGNLLKSRTELSIAQMLEFLQIEYQYNYAITLKNGKKVNVDFKTDKGLIEVIDAEIDIAKYKELKAELSDMKIIAMGH